MRALWVGVGLAAAAVATACLWDYDTLAAESKGLPELRDVIAGRFDVNPPEYYERRLELMEEKRTEGTLALADYDNAAMAYDRLGRTREAYEWLEAKRVRLVKEQPKERGDDWYTFYANRGTVYSHDWSRQGMAKKKIKLLDKALADLDKAIQINPQAHFGRETVQIEILKLAKDFVLEKYDRVDDWKDYVEKDRLGVQKGVIGIMSLGIGWNSPDLYTLLASTADREDAAVKDALLVRAEQFSKLGQKHWINKDYRPDLMLTFSEAEDYQTLEREVAILSANGDEYRASREEFVRSQLAKGLHPDKDKTFWQGLPEVAAVELKTKPKRRQGGAQYVTNVVVGVLAGGGMSVLLAAGALLVWQRRRKAASQLRS